MTAIPLSAILGAPTSAAEMLARAGVDAGSSQALLATLPFGPGDATCGVENELQAVVQGPREAVDLPLFIEESRYYHNIIRRHRRGEITLRVISDLEGWLESNPDGVWENSWVRIPAESLSSLAQAVWEGDLRADKSDPSSPERADAERFRCRLGGRPGLRFPVSYLLKLALADVIGSQPQAPAVVSRTGLGLTRHFLSDNTSPETYSFHVVPLTPEAGMGRAVAAETAKRFLLTQALVQYADHRFELGASGQKVAVYFAPLPPQRQKQLNEHISDSFYRELFMSPCLSGWDRGEDKHAYMHLCHATLSRAQMNGLALLREAGIIVNNLVVLPRASNISLANNGTHISLGSRRLGRALADRGGAFGPEQEKHLADLAIKFVEHFLPLSVGTFGASPYRLDFKDFHPEKVLSFLPYELDYTHLRMLWRRWRKKARIKLRPFGFRTTPFGPVWLDNLLSRAFRLRGDFVDDYRLLDYLVGVLSTDACPALDGRLGNQERLKEDLAALGVFDPRMALYLLYRQREHAKMGYTGFEGRHYSLFAGFQDDLGRAAELQLLITALAYRLMASGKLTHAHLPDLPEVESERRQILFGAATGVPTFFVAADTPNLVLREILEHCRRTRASRRYPGYIRVYNQEYRKALIRYIAAAAPELVEGLGLGGMLDDLARRLEPGGGACAERLTRGVLDRVGSNDPYLVDAESFNRAAEAHYREDLRRSQMAEACDLLAQDLAAARFTPEYAEPAVQAALAAVAGGRDPAGIIADLTPGLLAGGLELTDLTRFINLMLISLHLDARAVTRGWEARGDGEDPLGADDAPIHRAAHR